MSKRNWIRYSATFLIVATAVVALVALSLSLHTYFEQKQAAEERTRNNYYKVQEEQIAALLLEPEKQQAASERRERRRENREESGLNAQWASANWTMRQTAIGIFGLIGLFLTVHFARKTWFEARRAAILTETELRELRVAASSQLENARQQLDAARDSVSAAREGAETSLDIQQKQSRAYMITLAAKYMPFSTQDPVYQHVAKEGHIKITIKNIGQTAAKNVVVRASTTTSDAAQFQWVDLEYSWPHRLSNIAPGQEADAVCIPTQNVFVPSVENLPMPYAILRGEIRYSDVFDKRFRTCFIFWSYRGAKDMTSIQTMTAQEAVMPAFEEIEADPNKD